MSVFGKLKRPAVTFLHQRHTEALENKNKDCSACYLSENNRMSTQYMRLKNTNPQAVRGELRRRNGERTQSGS